MPTKAKGPDNSKRIPVVEYPSGIAVDHSKDRASSKDGGSIGKDPMTGKDYFYRGGIGKTTPDA